MSDPKARTPAETMRAILDEAGKDAVAEALTRSPAEVDARLKAAGVDPAEAERRATAAIEAALASVGETAEPAPADVAPLRPEVAPLRAEAVPLRAEVVPLRPAVAPRKDLAPPARARRWPTWTAVAAAAAAVLAVGLVNREAIVARLRGTEPIGPDTYPPSSVATRTEPTPAEKALALRTKAFAACAESRWDPCLAWLDDAAELDPAGDTAPEVIAARKAAKKGEEDDARKLKPHAP